MFKWLMHLAIDFLMKGRVYRDAAGNNVVLDDIDPDTLTAYVHDGDYQRYEVDVTELSDTYE